MNKIQVFTNEEFGKIRGIEIDGEPWVVGKDVAEALGYKNTKDALATHVDDEDKRVLQRSEIATFENYIPKDVFPVEFINVEIPNRGLTFINESGLYSLVMSSKLPDAKQFKRWITSEVLPTIRKQGAYIPNNISPLLRELIELELEQKRQSAELEAVNQRVDATDEAVKGISNVVALHPESWREECRNLLAKVARARDNDYKGVNAECFELVDQRAGVSLQTRLTNKKRRMAEEGVCKSKRDRTTKVDVIADDKKLIEIYTAIVKEMAIKYAV